MVVDAVKNVPLLRVKAVEVLGDHVQVIFTAISTKMKTKRKGTTSTTYSAEKEFANKDQRMPAVQLRTVTSIL